MEGLGNLDLVAGNDIMLGVGDPMDPETGSAGDVSAAGDLVLDAEDSIYAHGELSTENATAGVGNIHLYSSDTTTHIYGNINADVDDDGDIVLHNVSEAADGVILTAGDDVLVLERIEAQGDLTMNAIGGAIEADAVMVY